MGLILILWSPLYNLALYDGYLCSIDVFFSVDIVDSSWSVFFNGHLNRLCWSLSYKLLYYSWYVLNFNFAFVVLWFVTLYYFQKGIIGKLVVSIFIFRISSVIIIEAPTSFIELNAGAISKIHVDCGVHSYVKSDAESTRKFIDQ